MEKQEAIKLWKELKIESCTMEFSCGGDSMNDYSFIFYGSGKEIESVELKDYFEEAVFDNEEFYVNSDSVYQGESGNVEITLDDDNEEEEDFSYSKVAQSEYEEQHEEETFIAMPKPMLKFIKENVANINGSSEEVIINFKKDLILSDAKEKIMVDIQALLKDKICEFESEELTEELNDYRTFTTSEEGEPIIKGNSLKVDVTVNYTEYRDSD